MDVISVDVINTLDQWSMDAERPTMEEALEWLEEGVDAPKEVVDVLLPV